MEALSPLSAGSELVRAAEVGSSGAVRADTSSRPLLETSRDREDSPGLTQAVVPYLAARSRDAALVDTSPRPPLGTSQVSEASTPLVGLGVAVATV